MNSSVSIHTFSRPSYSDSPSKQTIAVSPQSFPLPSFHLIWLCTFLHSIQRTQSQEHEQRRLLLAVLLTVMLELQTNTCLLLFTRRTEHCTKAVSKRVRSKLRISTRILFHRELIIPVYLQWKIYVSLYKFFWFCFVCIIRILAFKYEGKFSTLLLTSKVWSYTVIITSQEAVQDFGYVPVVVELRLLQASGPETKKGSWFALSEPQFSLY